MKEFIEKIEDFFFDFLGLILPGFIIVLLIIMPLSLLDFRTIDQSMVDNSKVLSILINMTKYVDYFFKHPTEVIIGLLILISYIIGHLVKVLSILEYEILESIFDHFINRLVRDLIKQINRFVIMLKTRVPFFNSPFWQYFSSILKSITAPIVGIFNKTFTFRSPNYFNDNEILKKNCIEIINKRFNTEFPNTWYSLFKLSSIITNQENLKSLAPTFLAKYNFYRSMAFIFSIVFFYYLIFFKTTKLILSNSILTLDSFILLAVILLWFTFHYKYKRYWTLCGNETLISLFYYLKKPKSNEG